MQIQRTTLLLGFAVLVAIGAFFTIRGFFIAPDIVSSPTPTQSPLASDGSSRVPRVTPTPEGVPFGGFPNQGLIPSSPPRELITGPGSCELSGGKIIFLSPSTARHENAVLTYRNIDSPARLISWRTQPDDGVLRIGPNIFSGLNLPNGSTTLTVTLNNQNHASRYTLTALASYGIFKDSAVIGTTEAPCAGRVTVEFNY